MSAPTTTSHPYDHARRYPDGEGPRSVDWQGHSEYEGPADRWTSRELVTFEHDDNVYAVVADPSGYPFAMRAEVAGELRWFDDDDEINTAIRDALDDAEDRDPDSDPDDDPSVIALRAVREAWDAAMDDRCDQAEGPMMNSFYLLERGGFGGRDVDITAWARELDGLPLCAVELDGDYGLALTGGGMDLSWEIAEAHLRLGYRVPTWVDLPAMAQGGRLGKDFGGTTLLDDDDAAIVRAAIRDRRAEAERHTYAANRLAERYGITETVED